MSSPNRSTSDIEDAFSSMNILNYTSVSSDYFPASSGSSSFNSSENSTNNMIPLEMILKGGLTLEVLEEFTASKPQTLEEAINIAQRLMDQIIKHDSVQEANDHKRKLEDKGNIINNNYQNNYFNNNRKQDHHTQQNKKQETFRIILYQWVYKDRPCLKGAPASLGVIPTTSVSRLQLKGNRMGDRVLPNNSQGKKQIEDHRRNFKFSNNKTFVTACNDSLNAKTLNVNFVCVTCGKCVLNDNHDMCVLHYINGVNSRTRQLIVVPISTREHTQTVNQSVATSYKKTVATNSTVKKPRNIIRKIYEMLLWTCSWWYPKFTPPEYKWKPKSTIGNVNLNASMPLGNESRNANILEHMTPRCSTLSNTTLSSNSFAAREMFIQSRL
ncbi:hypothetical protein Tco_0798709 [Tanacetum coccineum]